MDGDSGRMTAALHQTLLFVLSVVDVRLSYEQTRGLMVLRELRVQRIAAVYISDLLRLIFTRNAAE